MLRLLCALICFARVVVWFIYVVFATVSLLLSVNFLCNLSSVLPFVCCSFDLALHFVDRHSLCAGMLESKNEDFVRMFKASFNWPHLKSVGSFVHTLFSVLCGAFCCCFEMFCLKDFSQVRVFCQRWSVILVSCEQSALVD